MKTLIVEDDLTSRRLIQGYMESYGPTHLATNGTEAIAAFSKALIDEAPFDLVCLDIMMPGLDGQATLKVLRDLEEERGIFSSDGAKIVMTTALSNMANLARAFKNLCDGYLVKPISKARLVEELTRIGLLDSGSGEK
ncbi:response regulator [Desulfatiferula olefinivorans]